MVLRPQRGQRRYPTISWPRDNVDTRHGFNGIAPVRSVIQSF
jgi:hypothetical protein